MLEQSFYNLYEISNIPSQIKLSSSEFMKELFSNKSTIAAIKAKAQYAQVNGEEEIAILKVSGSTTEKDFYGRNWVGTPFSRDAQKAWPMMDLRPYPLFRECDAASLSMTEGFIIDQIRFYQRQLNDVDRAINAVNRFARLPFFINSIGGNAALKLRNEIKTIMGSEWVDTFITLMGNKGISQSNFEVIKNPVAYIGESLQNTKNKILSEAYLFLGVSGTSNKATTQTELEIEKGSEMTHVINRVVITKVQKFLDDISKIYNVERATIRRVEPPKPKNEQNNKTTNDASN